MRTEETAPDKMTWHGEGLPAFPERMRRVILVKQCGGLIS